MDPDTPDTKCTGMAESLGGCMENATLQSANTGHDSPISSSAEDLYGSFGVAKSIHRVLRAAPKDWSTRVGLYGTWGSGKTSVLNLLEGLETADNAIVVRFSAWAASGEFGVMQLFYASIEKSFKQHRVNAPWIAKTKLVASKGIVPRTLGRIALAVARGAGALDSEGTSAVSEFAASWLKLSAKEVSELRQQLEGRRVVVFIDDLDRADPIALPKTLLALREVLDLPSFSFVLAFDPRVVAEALRSYSPAYGDRAELFLEKIIDVPFTMPRPTAQQKMALAKHAFRACCSFVPTHALVALDGVLPNEPRRIKQIARALGALADVASRHDEDEVDWLGLCCYRVLVEADPRTAERLYVSLCDDPESIRQVLVGRDREEAMNQWREEFGKSLSTTVEEEERARIVESAHRLIQQWGFLDTDSIRRTVKLLSDEPLMTRKEFRLCFSVWASRREDCVLEDCVGSDDRDRAAEFIKYAIAEYTAALSAMADATRIGELGRLQSLASSCLSLLEHVWCECTVPSLKQASASGVNTAELVGVVTRWLTWRNNPGEPDLRGRERSLALRAVAGTVDPEVVYESTDPYFGGYHSLGDALTKGARELWVSEVRRALAPRILSTVVGLFTVEHGLEAAARGQSKLHTWLLESEKSPLYRDTATVNEIVGVLDSATVSDARSSATVAQNALTFLRLVLGQTRDASWGGAAAIAERHRLAPSLLPSAWRAASSVPVPFRMASGLSEVRDALMAQGIAAEVLPAPNWLAMTLEGVRRRTEKAN